MRIDIQSFFAPRAASIFRWLEVVVVLTEIGAIGLWIYTWVHVRGSVGVAVFVATILLIVLAATLRWLRQVRDAVSVIPTWGEGLFAGVRWGWRPDKPLEVLGPYCPNLGHATRLRPAGSNRDATDADVIGATVPLTCPADAAERFDFSSLSPQPTSIGAVRQRLQTALGNAGVWKGRQPQ